MKKLDIKILATFLALFLFSMGAKAQPALDSSEVSDSPTTQALEAKLKESRRSILAQKAEAQALSIAIARSEMEDGKFQVLLSGSAVESISQWGLPSGIGVGGIAYFGKGLRMRTRVIAAGFATLYTAAGIDAIVARNSEAKSGLILKITPEDRVKWIEELAKMQTVLDEQDARFANLELELNKSIASDHADEIIFRAEQPDGLDNDDGFNNVRIENAKRVQRENARTH
ncbi:hypothetical protein GW915_11190 [bacterium]|nr:hypothetical protein [bacterium]